MKEEQLQNKLRLFSSSIDHMWVFWKSDYEIEVIETSDRCPILANTYDLREIVSKIEFSTLREFRKKITYKVSNQNFTLNIEGKKSKIDCFALKDDGKVLCLWKISEKDESVSLLQNAAHDFRSPLGSILGFVNLMKNSIQSGKSISGEEGKLYLDMISKSTDKALGLTSEIMELAEIESDSYHLDVEKVVVAEFLKRYLATHRLITFKKGIKIEFKTECAKSAFINEFKLTRALDNVMSNAVKFSKEGSLIVFQLLEEKGTLKIVVKDQGIGMSQEILDHLFEKFSKSKRKGLSGEASHGLGMSIVRQIMLLHDGNVTVDSEEGVGTEVSLYLKIVE